MMYEPKNANDPSATRDSFYFTDRNLERQLKFNEHIKDTKREIRLELFLYLHLATEFQIIVLNYIYILVIPLL